MSFGHVRLLRSDANEITVEYIVESTDLNEGHRWEEIGRILIDRVGARYVFYPGEIYRLEKILPPEIFGLEEEKKIEILKLRYHDFGWGAISQRIHHWATTFIERKSFPFQHPESFFRDS